MGNKTPVLMVAKEHRDPNQPERLSTGYMAIIVPVAASLIDKVTSRIKDPPIPVIQDTERGPIENPLDPAFIAACKEADHKRTEAAIDTMAIMGVSLPDGVPDDEKWLPQLRLLEKLGHFDLSPYDLTVPLEREFVFKRFVALGNEDLKTLTERLGVSADDIAAAEANFPGDEAR